MAAAFIAAGNLITGPMLMHAIFPTRPLDPGYSGRLATVVLRALGYAGD